MGSPAAALGHDWLGACRRSAAAIGAVLAATTPGADRLRETGTVGRGGDRTLVLDQAAEDAVFAELDALYAAGARFTAVSEERGVVGFGDPAVRVVVDPIDGSLNAKRGLGHHALSIAVADGPTMADVVFGYVFDFGPGEEWRAERGAGAWLDDVPLAEVPAERRTPQGRLELVAVESAAPARLQASSEALVAAAHRVRAIGAIAVSLCQVAAGRVDGMASLGPCRSVDAAAGQLVVRESGGLVAFPGLAAPLAAPLDDLRPLAPVVAARSSAALELVAAIPAL
ncbi:MAG TPA: inositol monophosphatase family protein [Solirubrobacteraceae bacterium]|nr:inositol monophosphatase family protein [Solirubrobacteraceae bacterium]